MVKIILGSLIVYEGFQGILAIKERQRVFKQARAYADNVGKPLLVVGTPKWGFNHPCGDVTIDIQTGLGKACNVEMADVRNIPYPSYYFGAAYCSHVLEHLPTIKDAVQALNEMERVSNKVFVVSPDKSSLLAQLWHGHHLWVIPTDDGYIIEQRGEGQPRKESYLISMEVV